MTHDEDVRDVVVVLRLENSSYKEISSRTGMCFTSIHTVLKLNGLVGMGIHAAKNEQRFYRNRLKGVVRE